MEGAKSGGAAVGGRRARTGPLDLRRSVQEQHPAAVSAAAAAAAELNSLRTSSHRIPCRPRPRRISHAGYGLIRVARVHHITA